MTNDSRKHEMSAVPAADPRALRIIAKSLYRELRAQGHTRGDIVVFTNALLELVAEDTSIAKGAPLAEAAE